MKNRIGRIVIPALVLMLLFGTAVVWYWAQPAEARTLTIVSDKLGSFTGPVSGTESDDNVKAALDLIADTIGAPMSAKGTGEVYFVDSGASGGETGLNWTDAVLTLEEGLDLCTADRGDFLLVAAGHAETLTAQDIDLDKGNVTVIGLGSGENRPVFSYNHANAEIAIGADDISIYNIEFMADITAVTNAINIETTCENFIIENCRFSVNTDGTDEFVDTIVVVATGTDGGLIKDCLFRSGLKSNGDPDSGIYFVDCNDLHIIGNTFEGDFADACIFNETTAANNVLIKDNVLFNGIIGGNAGLNTKPCISLYASTSGAIINNQCITNVVSPQDAIVAADCFGSGNTYSESESVSEGVVIGKSPEADILAAMGIAETDGTTRGMIVYVDSGETSGIEDGLSWATAHDTLNEAIDTCTADDGAVIFVAPGHAENMGTTDPDLDVAGITVIGLGVGEQRPVFSADTSTDIFEINADDVAVYNLEFLAHTPDVAKGINVTDNSENVIISGCRFSVHTEATDEFLVTICVGANADNILIENCEIANGGGASTSAILFDGAYEYCQIRNNIITGKYSTACIYGDATGDGEMLLIKDNILYNGDITIGLVTEPCIELKSATTGVIHNNVCLCNVATPDLAIVGADMHLAGNTYNETEGSYLEAGKVYTMSMTSVVTATTDTIMTVAGGAIEIISMFGQVTTIQAADIGNLSITLDAGAGADYDADFSIVVAAANGMLGDVYTFGAITNAENAGVAQANENAGYPLSWFCPAGLLIQTTSSTGTGAIKWYVTFRVLDEGVTVTPG